MPKRTLECLNVNGKRVLVRADLNVPLNDRGQITDDSRIRASLPTIEHLLKRSACVILMSHLGRPDGRPVSNLSLRRVATRLRELLGQPVALLPDCVGPQVEAQVAALKPGETVILENLRFHPGEETNDPQFAAALARLGECYVNDAFGSAHREHASISSAITSLLPSAVGLLMAKELEYLSMALESPPRPFYAVLGGAKVSDKIAVIRSLLEKVDGLIIGGGMSNTFQNALNRKMGISLSDDQSKALSLELIQSAQKKGVELHLPLDYIIVDPKAPGRPELKVVEMPEPGVPEGWGAVDIGPKTCKLFTERLSRARCVLWNGPVGVYEVPLFAEGTRAVAQAIAALTPTGAVTILGGGDTAAAVHKFGLNQFSHISTGGGASLEFLGGIQLPGVLALPDR